MSAGNPFSGVPGARPAQFGNLSATFEQPSFQYNLARDIQSRQEQNRRQRLQNQATQQSAAEQAARLGLDLSQFEFQTQDRLVGLLQQLLGAQQTGSRTLSDLALRLVGTQQDVERSRLLDELRLVQSQGELNRIIDTPADRARRLLGR